MNSQHGTYVVHTILENWNAEEQITVLENILSNIFELSKLKYGSNAIEKCLEKGANGYFLNRFYSILKKKIKNIGGIFFIKNLLEITVDLLLF